MKGYIYTMFAGADPGNGWQMTDPIFGKVPTMGACMPQIRRAVNIDDYIFTISGRVKNLQQYVVGGFQVQEKINALLAYQRYPEYRQVQDENGKLSGNIIVDVDGNQNPYDYHRGNFEKRIQNYIIGKNPNYISDKKHVEQARGKASLEILSDVFGKSGNKPHDIIGRWRKLDERQVEKILNWLDQIKVD